MIPDGQPPHVAFKVSVQLYDPKADETDMGATLFTKNGEGRTLTSTDLLSLSRNERQYLSMIPATLNRDILLSKKATLQNQVQYKKERFKERQPRNILMHKYPVCT